jgi:MOSC domain-containing protein YiiM
VDLFIAEQGLTGWYFRVVEGGKMCVGDNIQLEHRLSKTCSIKDIMKLVGNKNAPANEKAEAASISGLAKEWVRKLRK